MMYRSLLSVAALAAGAAAQSMNLTGALASSPDLSNLTSYVSMFPQLLTTLGSAQNITILAPSNEAFAKFLQTPAAGVISAMDTGAIQAILEYHVLNGTYPASSVSSTPAFIHTLLNNATYANVTGGQVVEAVTQGSNVTFYSGLLNNSTVTKADVNFTGGVIHIVDTVLTVPVNISGTAVDAGLTAAAGALTKADLVSTLDSAKDVTVFAPNNAAFEAIGSALPNLSVSQLTGILEYHVVNGTVGYSSSLMNGSSLPTLAGGNLTITIENGEVFVNSAKVVTPNVLVAEGVVHVIDNVLNPNNTSVKPNPSASTQSAAYAGASSVSGANALTSGISAPTTPLVGAGPTPASTTASSGGSGGSPSPSMSGSASSGAAGPARTAAVNVAALLGGAAMLINV